MLLRTVAALLNIIEEMFEVNGCDNYLMTVTKEFGYQKKSDFAERMCECCGNCSAE